MRSDDSPAMNVYSASFDQKPASQQALANSMAAASTQKTATDHSNHADGAPEHVLVNVLMQPQDFEKPASAVDVNACIREAYLAMKENDWDRSGESGLRICNCGSWNNWSQ